MGKLEAQNFDMQILAPTQGYYMAMSRGDWETAAHCIVVKNNCIREKNRISDLKPYILKSRKLRDELNNNSNARDWCMRFAPLVEMAVTRERDLLAVGYDR